MFFYQRPPTAVVPSLFTSYQNTATEANQGEDEMVGGARAGEAGHLPERDSDFEGALPPGGGGEDSEGTCGVAWAQTKKQ